MNIFDLQPQAWQHLQARREQLPHALLLSGPRGVGKLEIAQAFAASLLCEHPRPDQQACGQCPACNWFSQGNHPDFRLVQPAAMGGESGEEEGDGGKKKPSQQITIEQIRELDEFLHVGTHRQGRRIVLLHPAEAMNRSTANSLLKGLEEPLPGTLFLLVSHEPDRLLPTIRSRCQRVDVFVPAADLAERWLAEQGLKEAARWLALAGGAPLLAVNLAANQQAQLLETMVKLLSQGGRLAPLEAAGAVERLLKGDKSGTLALRWVMEWVQKWTTDLILASHHLVPRFFMGEVATIEQLAQSADQKKLFRFNKKVYEFKVQSEHPLNSRLFLEEVMFAYQGVFPPPGGNHVRP